jgi:AbrB family looped-hinge helix DNA binding protein
MRTQLQSTVDKFGRVVVPKPVRDRLRLVPGTVLSFEERVGEVVLHPVWDEPSLTYEDGVLVYSGRAAGDLADAVETQRRARADKLAAMNRA